MVHPGGVDQGPLDTTPPPHPWINYLVPRKIFFYVKKVKNYLFSKLYIFYFFYYVLIKYKNDFNFPVYECVLEIYVIISVGLRTYNFTCVNVLA